MSKSGICIICRENKDDLSDEHVIPESIGGYYHIYMVCKKCNSELGRNVDIKLIEHGLTKLMRFSTSQQGKRKQVPNPFSGTHKFKDDNTKVRLDIKNNSELKPYILPNYQNKYDEQTKTHNFSFQIDGSERHLINEKASLVLRRAKIDEEQIKNILKDLNPITTQIDSPIEVQMTIDTKEFKIGLLKIAYEFAVDTIPEYFEDTQAIEISKVLQSADISNIDKYFFGSFFEKNILELFEHMFDFNKNRHILILTSSQESGLICFIALKDLFTIAVKLSNNSHNCLMHIGINDLENKRFEKLDIFETIKRQYPFSEYRHEFFFQTEKESIEFQNLQLTNDFRYYTIDDKLPVFDTDFKIKYYDTELVDKYLYLSSDVTNNSIDNKVYVRIPEKLYIRILPSNKYVQLTGIEVERKLVKI